MKNPMTLKTKDGRVHSIGDPFVMRFNGEYFLYPSSLDTEDGVRCFTSKDLVNFQDCGFVVRDSRLINAYAPEVIYINGYFYMCTSPKGNGHYFLKADNPLGPFSFITDNIQNMIDGSFVQDEDFSLHFVRAGINGIPFFDVENEKIVKNRKDILPSISNKWTEGPTIFYRDGYYYATYCGNHLLSSAYRVKNASSHFIDRDYTVQDGVFLISTDKKNGYIGHNSIVLGPNLDQYYAIYHQLSWLKTGGFFRKICIDPIQFNGQRMTCNPCFINQMLPVKPAFECCINKETKNMIFESVFILSPQKTLSNFTVEFNFSNETTIIFSYIDQNNYSYIHVKDNQITCNTLKKGCKTELFDKKLSISFNVMHALRIVNGSHLEMLIDNVKIFESNNVFEPGKIGFIYKDSGLFYIAYSNFAFGSSIKNRRLYIPGNIESTSFNCTGSVLVSNDSKCKCIVLNKNDEAKVSIFGKNKDTYRIYGMVDEKSKCIIEVSSLQSSFKQTIIVENEEYSTVPYYFGTIKFYNKDELTIKVIEGTLKFTKIILKKQETIKSQINEKSLLKKQFYLFNNPASSISVDFMYDKLNDGSMFGIILNCSNFSHDIYNSDPCYMGYFVGLRNKLLVIGHAQYSMDLIYDFGLDFDLNIFHKLKAEINNFHLSVYLDGKLLRDVCLKYDDVYGLSGIYKNKEAKVKFMNFEEIEL